MICPATGVPHRFIEVREGVRICPDCNLTEYDQKGNVIYFPDLFDDSLPSPGRKTLNNRSRRRA
jgi:hypothetical protein